ncbi:TrmH family RNA methyltransferase [Anaerostipes sp.]|uniref:TrmH family RNA methyltransferase n=1 Tax=Anaerostipes sp. TaxID=1872530 RepID=UPI0025BAA209|nr:RNA methyltransferase [Anaerostipes sp.]MBS7007080.1 RNA methyltransferase [Anaerostipes sp.]
MITTSQNKQIKQAVKLLKSSRERKKTGLFVAEGLRMFREIPEELREKVFVSSDFLKEHKELLRGISFEEVSPQVFREISDTETPQGILSLVRMQQHSVSEILKQSGSSILLLENLQDPGNLGTLVRTGEGAGVSGVIMSKDTVDIYNPKVIRSTMGSVFRVPFCYVEDLSETVGLLRQQSIHVYAAHLNGTDYTDESYDKLSAFLIGNEGNGLTDRIAALADKRIRIPMEGRVESLNAAMAGGLLMYEARRQRKGGS